ncbi:hypothetical protein DITRI_Ditri04bG0188700 [Diplodiscus trichospermus]
MRRKKGRAKRRAVRSIEEEAVEVEMEDPVPSENVMQAAKAGNKGGKDIDREFDCFKEEFEEVENVVSAVMEMDTIIQQNQIKNGGNVVENESNSEMNDVKGLEDSEKSDDLDVSLKYGEFEETMEEGSGGVKILNTNIEVSHVDSGNEIEIGEEAEVHENAEQKSDTRIKEMKSDRNIDDSYSHKEEEDGGKKKSRDVWEQNEDIEVCDVNESPKVLNHDSLTKQQKEKQLEIHVGGLHKATVEQDLFEVFGKFGEVKIATIVRHSTTKKSGFAFIQYATVEQAKKVLSDFKDGIEVRGKRAKLSISHDHDILYLGNICKTWTKEDVLQKLKGYGIEDVAEIKVPSDPKKEGKIKGFAFLRFDTCFAAKAAFHHLRKPDAVFGTAKGAKVAFARTPMHQREEARLQVKTVYVEGIPKSWDVRKLKEICEQYGETKKVKISRNFCYKGKDFGFFSFTTRESAVACVGGMNKLQFGGNVKVNADIARPLVGGRLQRSSRGGLKLNKRHRSTGWRKMKGYARFEGAEKERDMKAQTIPYKSEITGMEEKTAAVVHKKNHDPLNSNNIVEGETNEQQSIALEAHDAGARLSTKPKKTNDKRKNRKKRRDRMYRKRWSKKPEGSSQGRPSHSSRKSKSRSHLRKGPQSGSHSIAYRIPYKEAASTSGYPGSGYGAISGSKRLSSDLEPHAGFVQLVKHEDEYHAASVTPAFLHQRQTYAGYLKLDTQYERQPPAKYFKPAIREDALPHAGFLEPGFRKQNFDVDDYPVRRIGEFNSPGNQGPVHVAGSALPLPYVPTFMSYARYEANGSGYHKVSGAYPPTQTHYRTFA